MEMIINIRILGCNLIQTAHNPIGIISNLGRQAEL